MAIYSDGIISEINVALNEATVLGIEFHKEKEIVAVTIAPIALDRSGELPADNRVQFVFKPVGKFIASYRLIHGVGKLAETVYFEPEEISEKVKEFGRKAIFGQDFIDGHHGGGYAWLDHLSFEFNSESKHGRQHSIELFQEGNDKRLDLKIWFDTFDLYNFEYEIIDIQDFIDNGRRGWTGMFYGNAAEKFDIYSLPDGTPSSQPMGAIPLNLSLQG